MRLALLMVLLLISAALAEEPPGSLDKSLFPTWEQTLNNRYFNEMRINAITNNDIKSLSLNRELLLTHNARFNHELKSNGITSQGGSGRCWLFAGLNVFAPKAMADLNMEAFELSHAYLSFYDKLEKANCFLEDIIKYRDSSLDSYTMQVVLESPFGDGGWWHYVTDLMEKYGAVPVSAMPESRQSKRTGRINNLVSTMLRGHAAELRQMHADGKSEKRLRARKQWMLADVYIMLVYAYGKPPEEFDFRYEFKPEKDTTKVEAEDSLAVADSSDVDLADAEEDEPEPYDVTESHTPQSFYEKYVKPHIKEYVAVCHNPNVEIGRLYELEGGRNIHGRPDMQVLNLPIERLKDYAVASLLDSQIVWFACDVGKENYSDSGIFMRGIYDYTTTFGVVFDKLTKAQRIAYDDMSPNHAMVLRGVDTSDAGEPVKWLVENSWGSKAGKNGEWTMYDSWFDEYVYVVIVDKELLIKDDIARLSQPPIVVPYWQPFFRALRQL